jgi:hypothetical protein
MSGFLDIIPGEENKAVQHNQLEVVNQQDIVIQPDLIKKLQEENTLLKKKISQIQNLQTPLWFYDRELANIHYDKIYKLKSEIDMRLFLLEPYAKNNYNCILISLLVILSVSFICTISCLSNSWYDSYEPLLIFYSNLMIIFIIYLIGDYINIYIKSKKLQNILRTVKSFYTIDGYDISFLIYSKD